MHVYILRSSLVHLTEVQTATFKCGSRVKFMMMSSGDSQTRSSLFSSPAREIRRPFAFVLGALARKQATSFLYSFFFACFCNKCANLFHSLFCVVPTANCGVIILLPEHFVFSRANINLYEHVR